MSPRQYWESKDSDNEKLCQLAKTSLANFKQIALFGGSVGVKLALRMAKASTRCNSPMSLEEILTPKDAKMIAARKNRADVKARRAEAIKEREKQEAAAA